MNDAKSFECPHCGQQIRYNAQWIGKRARCKACNQVFVVAEPAEDAPPIDLDALIEPARDGPPSAHPASRSRSAAAPGHVMASSPKRQAREFSVLEKKLLTFAVVCVLAGVAGIMAPYFGFDLSIGKPGREKVPLGTSGGITIAIMGAGTFGIIWLRRWFTSRGIRYPLLWLCGGAAASLVLSAGGLIVLTALLRGCSAPGSPGSFATSSVPSAATWAADRGPGASITFKGATMDERASITEKLMDILHRNKDVYPSCGSTMLDGNLVVKVYPVDDLKTLLLEAELGGIETIDAEARTATVAFTKSSP